MLWFWLVMLFVLGACLGSFLNVWRSTRMKAAAAASRSGKRVGRPVARSMRPAFESG